MESERDFSEVKRVVYLIVGFIDLFLAGACIKSNMRTIPKLGLTILCVERAHTAASEALKEIKVVK